MEETKNLELEGVQEQEEKSAIDFQLIYSTLEMVPPIPHRLFGIGIPLLALCHSSIPSFDQGID